MTKDYENWFAVTIVCYLVLWVLLWVLIARAGSGEDLARLEQLRKCKTLLQTALWLTLALLCWKSQANLLAGIFLLIAGACFVVFLKPELLVSNEGLAKAFQFNTTKSVNAPDGKSDSLNRSRAEQLDRAESKSPK